MNAETLEADLRFSIVPEWVIDAQLSDKALRLYCVLARYADNENLTAFPARSTLAKRMRCHRATVDRALDELISLGAITKQRRVVDGVYQSSVYTIRRKEPRGSRTDATGGSRTSATGGSRTSAATLSHPCSKELEPLNVEPVRTRTNSASVKKKAVRSRKHGLPASWQPDEKQLLQLREKFPKLSIEDETEKFQDYHRSKGSTFVDWDAAFRNWCRNAEKYRLQQTGEKAGGWR